MNPASEALAGKIRRKLNSDSFRLPALPDTVTRVQQRMAGDDYAVADIAGIISKDTNFATVILRLANSVHFNTTGKEIRNLTMAIQRIGMEALPILLLSIASRMFCKINHPGLRKKIQHNQEHSLLVAIAAERVALVSGAANPADTFMAGLLHDQGKDVLIMAIPEELTQATSDECLALLDMFHHEMGARLLHTWGLPTEFVLVAQHHGNTSDDRPKSPLLDCVDAASIIAHCIETGSEECRGKRMSQPVVKKLRLSDIDLADIEISIEDQIEELRQVFAT